MTHRNFALVDIAAIHHAVDDFEEAKELAADAAGQGLHLILVKPMQPILDDDRRAAMAMVPRAGGATTNDWSLIMAALDELKAAVAKNTSVIESTLVLISDLANRTAASSDPDMQALSAELNAESEKLASAVLANTKAATVEPSTEAPAEAPPA